MAITAQALIKDNRKPEISTGHHSPESAQQLGLKIQAHKVRWDHYQLTAVNSAALNYAGVTDW